ncbi:fungal-specific transcription factor domain-containing protein [Dactylonectria macrodidyma]|uniref:Fungal-specific transcription factor domain-containing protein n=1 Tax=Dactylonectria macrodidyma TaxID=307937 RepID=A0A9P9FPM6_9HYPO|nr:fungal-specific transcription factor domain-containing protein [Dactylonectria macrodidyma]
MARGRVADEFRRRTAKACYTCQRRKQKCAGGQPCEACTKRNIECIFGTNDPSSSDSSISSGPSFTRRKIEECTGLRSHLDLLARLGSQGQGGYLGGQMIDHHQRTTSGQDKEFKVPPQPPMLPGPIGRFCKQHVFLKTLAISYLILRLVFVGDPATFTYLQAIRVKVEEVAGPSQFTLDSQRHSIIEPCVNTPDQIPNTPMLLEKKVVDLLVKYYFTNTYGLMDILDQRGFRKSLNSWYSNSCAVKPSSRCLIYLVLAIGLVMATPEPNTPEIEIITGIQSQNVHQAECFFRDAKDLANTVPGFEDGDIWSIQAHSLMSVYMLTVSKWTDAYAYLGAAVRSAYALGLHKGLGIATGSNELVAERRNLWRSLFVLDRFLATSLGWPVVISEGACSEDSLAAPPVTKTSGKKRRRSQSLSSSGLDACVQASEIISQVLRRVYSGTRISTRVAHEIADACKHWAHNVHSTLDWVHLFNSNSTPAQEMAILHIQLLGCHTIMLLTRPFFLHKLSEAQLNVPGSQVETQQPNPRLDLLSEACVTASMQIIRLVYHVFGDGRLPQRSQFVMNFLFAATLTVLSNKFAHLHANNDQDASIAAALNVMLHFSNYDTQARGLVSILMSFQQVVLGQQTPGVSGGPIQSSHEMYRATMPTFSFQAPQGPPRQQGESESYPLNPPRLGRANFDRSASQISHAPMNDQRKAPRGLTESDPASRGPMVSPANSAASLSQPTSVPNRLGMDPEGAGPIGNQDSIYWTFVPGMGLVSQVQTPGSGSGGMAQVHSAETGDSAVYSHPAQGIADEPTNQTRRQGFWGYRGQMVWFHFFFPL